jgi:hypothetical protein
VPVRTVRVRIGGLTLALRDPRPRAPGPPPSHRPFRVERGGDIRIEVAEADPPSSEGLEVAFDSGGVWRAFRHDGGLLYEFRALRLEGQVYKALAIDAALRRGTLYLPPDSAHLLPRWALDYPLDELLFQHRLAREGAVEVHGCGVVWKGRTLLFCGQSGAGKSTTARLWKRHARGARLLSDDRVVLRPGARGVRAHGTPWHGDGGFASPASAPLGALFFLEHAKANRLRPLSAAEAAARLFARSFPPPWDVEGVEGALDACADAAAKAPAFVLAFRPDRTAVEAVHAVVGRPRR